MDVYLSRGENDAEIWLRFPAEPDVVWPAITELDQRSISSDPVKIVRIGSSVDSLMEYIGCVDLEEESDIRKLNQLAERIDRMDEPECRIFSAALDIENAIDLDSVIRVTDHLNQYEFLEGVTEDWELGGWLVDHDCLDVSFPKAVRPYLDYAAIGAKYNHSHGGAFTLNGYVMRQEIETELAKEKKRPLQKPG